jgi:hypothetical protein
MNPPWKADRTWLLDNARQWLRKCERRQQKAEVDGRNLAFHRQRGRTELLRLFVRALERQADLIKLQEQLYNIRCNELEKTKELSDGEDRWLAQGKAREAYALFRFLVIYEMREGNDISSSDSS